MNGLTNQNLQDQGLFNLGKASNFFTEQSVAKIEELDLKVYHGNSYKINMTE